MTNNIKPLGIRMKTNYESRQCFYLTRRTPVIIRVDGRAFHSLTKSMNKPFDYLFMNAMVESARLTAQEIQGFKLAYVQSDEASFLLTDYDNITTEAWFDYNKSKIESITASLMSVHLSKELNLKAAFDARAFNIPEDEITNYFLWRTQDWYRNSLQMYCQAHFSHKQLNNKDKADQHEMLHSVGLNWTTDLSDMERNGAFIMRNGELNKGILPQYEPIAKLVGENLKND